MSGLKIGTRGSKLALVQATATETALEAAFPGREVERVVIKTTGDRRTDVALADVAKAEGILDKGVFIKELEVALEDDRIDIAVHSLKDVPTVLGDAFEIAGVLPRASVRDVLVCPGDGGLEGLEDGARIGTSSVRRAKQLDWLRPGLEVVDIRGNVPTRLRKLAAGDFDAILLAEAGLVRLGHSMEDGVAIGGVKLHFHPLPENEFLPAAGQGAIAFEIRAGDEVAREAVAAMNHDETFLRVTAEREFLRLLDGGCHTPVGVVTRLENGVLSMGGRVFPEAGGEPREGTAEGVDPIRVARELFETMS